MNGCKSVEGIAAEEKQIEIAYDMNNAAAKSFAQRCGFETKFASALMTYQGRRFEEDDICVRQYQDEDYLEAFNLADEAFHKMRLETGWFPDSVLSSPSEEKRKIWAKTADERYVCVVDDEIVGYARVDGAELDTVAIKIAHQGEGYGKAFVKFLVNRILEKETDEPFLYCVVRNKARKLYDSLGFKEIACNEYARKTLQADE